MDSDINEDLRLKLKWVFTRLLGFGFNEADAALVIKAQKNFDLDKNQFVSACVEEIISK